VIVVDVNLLLYAHLDAYPKHEQALTWWEQTINGEETVGLADPAMFAFVRLSTNARMFESPLAVGQALATVRGWLDRPTVERLTPGRRHLDIAFGLLEAAGTAGNLTTDAQLAAYAIELGGEVHSNDTDFGRFPDLRWVNPLAT
jgi:toxin-antitoxin system PIN domain toxin